MMRVIVFDLGGTLMEYEGMPHSWVDYYEQGIQEFITERQNTLLNTYFQRCLNIGR